MDRLRTRARTVALSLVILLTLASTLEAVGKSAAPPPFKITAIKAMLFYDEKGTFSDDLFTQTNLALWNTIIGEGSAGSPSNSTLVLVEVSGAYDPNSTTPNRKIEFTATESRRVILRRLIEISIGKNGKFYAPFWLYDTGCGHVKLSARIIGQTQASSMTKTIPFECGE